MEQARDLDALFMAGGSDAGDCSCQLKGLTQL